MKAKTHRIPSFWKGKRASSKVGSKPSRSGGLADGNGARRNRETTLDGSGSSSTSDRLLWTMSTIQGSGQNGDH